MSSDASLMDNTSSSSTPIPLSASLAATLAELLNVPSKRQPFSSNQLEWLAQFHLMFLTARDDRETHRFSRDITNKMQAVFPIIVTADTLKLAEGDEKLAAARTYVTRANVSTLLIPASSLCLTPFL
jgi:hypothetical protein